MATISLAVTVSNPGSGNKYYIDSVLQDTVNMTPGNTYQFDQSDSSNSGHPLRLSTTSDGTHNSGSEYTTGVTTNGTPGSAGAYTQIVVTASTAQTLYYYCSSHSGMGGSIVVGNASTLNYKNIAGFNIQNLSSDPVPYAQELADNPYGGVWSSGGNLNTAKSDVNLAGTQTQAVGFAGDSPAGYLAQTENYNGSSWTEVNDLNNARAISAGNGAYTSALCYSGVTPSPTYGTTGTIQTESWDGTNWTEVADMNTARRDTETGIGASSTSALCGDGRNSPPNSAMVDKIESWDGSSWTEVTELNTPRFSSAGAGPQTSAMIMGGRGVPSSPGGATQGSFLVETWNGSSWTETTEFSTMRSSAGSTGASSSAMLLFGGFDHQAPGRTVNTESWDGSSWTEVNNMATARNNLGGTGTYTLAITAGGVTPSYTSATEEWTFSGLPPATPSADYSDAIVGQIYYNSTTGQFKAIKTGGAPLGTWSSGGNLNTTRAAAGMSGVDNTSALVFGGNIPPATGNTEQYDGSSWTELNNMNTARLYLGGQGTATAAIGFGGGTESETWNGTSWTEGNDLNTDRDTLGSGSLAYTEGFAVGGWLNPGVAPQVESYDGTSWTETTEMNTARNGPFLSGDNTNAICSGGSIEPGVQTKAELWNGSSWTETGDINTARYNGGAGGTYTGALIFGGSNQAGTVDAETEAWNGTSWTEVNDLSSARNYQDGAGSSSVGAIYAGGGTPPLTNATEEWTAADFEIKTMTTS